MRTLFTSLFAAVLLLQIGCMTRPNAQVYEPVALMVGDEFATFHNGDFRVLAVEDSQITLLDIDSHREIVLPTSDNAGKLIGDGESLRVTDYDADKKTFALKIVAD